LIFGSKNDENGIAKAELVKFVQVKIFDPNFLYLNFFQSQVLFTSVINDKVNKTSLLD
jgi:hypothetical protein